MKKKTWEPSLAECIAIASLAALGTVALGLRIMMWLNPMLHLYH